MPLGLCAEQVRGKIRLSVSDYSGEDRVNEPVTGGVPLPKGFLFPDKQTDLLPLRMVDSKAVSVPAQFKAVAFWGDGSVQWVLVDFAASVEDSEPREFFLEKVSSIFPLKPGLKKKDTKDYLEIDTGKIRFRINKKRFNFLDFLTLQGSKPLVTSSEKSGLFLTAEDGTPVSSLGSPREVLVEEDGALRCVIRIRGDFTTAGRDIYRQKILAYTVRIYAYANQDFIRVFLTLENNGKYGYRHEKHEAESVRFIRLGFNLHLQLGGKRRIESDDFSDYFTPQDRFFLSQRHALIEETEEEENFSYIIKKNNSVEEEDKRAEGWIHIHDGDFGVIAGVRYFWQNHPKTLLFSQNTLSFGLWHQGGQWPP